MGLGFLAITSGSTDVIAFLTLGKVFASAMTGNVALLGIGFSRLDMVAASQPLTALFGFICGAALASALFDPNQKGTSTAAILRHLLMLEALCLVAFAALWQAFGPPGDGVLHYSLIILCSVAMGVQGIAAKRIKAPGLNTIVFTSTVVTIVLSVTEILLGRNRDRTIRSATKRQIAVFCAYGAGAVLAGLLYWEGFPLLVWMPAAMVLIALICYQIHHGQSKDLA